MDNEQLHTPKSNTEKSTIGRILKESINDAGNAVSNSKEVTNKPVQVVIGAMLAVSVSMLLALLGIQRIDGPVIVAAISIAIAIPFLGAGFILASQEYNSKVPTFMVNVLKVTNAFVHQFIGGIALAVALCSLLWHIIPVSAVTAIIAVVLAIVAPLFVMFAIIIMLIFMMRKAKVDMETVDLEKFIRNSKLSFLLENNDSESPK